MLKCPHCGQPFQKRKREELVKLTLSPKQRRILRALVDNPAGVSMSDMIGHAYDWGANEPEYPDKVIRVTVRYLRLKLEPVGWSVARNAGGAGRAALYRLEEIA